MAIPALARGRRGGLLLLVAAHDVVFLEHCASNGWVDGVIVGHVPDYRLVAAVRAAGAELVVDSGTASAAAGLGDERGDVEQALAAQRDGSVLTAPYVPVTGDPCQTATNLSLLEITAAVADPRRSVAVVSVERGELLAGAVTPLASPYASAGADTVVLRVVGVEWELANDAEVRAVVEAVESLAGVGLDVIVERAGRAGPALVAAGAWGFTDAAAPFYTSVGPTGGQHVMRGYEEPRRWRDVPRFRSHPGAVLPCPVNGCRALAPERCGRDLRAHRLHLLGRLARWAASAPREEIVDSLLAAPERYPRTWGAELRRMSRRSASA